MKKYLILLTVLCLAVVMAFGVMAETADDFAAAVLSANNVEQPEANVTKAELDAVVNRLSQAYSGTPNTNVGTDTTVVKRADAVKALYDVVNGKADLTVINTVNGMVDMDANDARFAACRAFMQAGIITGYNEYGSVGPDRNVKRYELALMVDRILNPAERVTKSYVLYSSDEPFYLIDNQLPTFLKNQFNHFHGWQYDYTGAKEQVIDAAENVDGTFINKLSDYFTDDDVSLSKFVETQDTGIMVFEAIANITFGDTFHFEFYDIDGNDVISAGWRDNAPYIGTVTGSANGKIAHNNGVENTIRIQLDLDDKVAKLWANGVYVGESAFTGTGANIAKVRMATDVAQTGTIAYKSVHMYKNYEVNDVFRLENSQYYVSGSNATRKTSEAPVGYTSSGASVETLASNPGNHTDDESLKISAGGYATREIEKPVGGKIVATAHVLADGAAGAFELKTADGEVSVFKVDVNNGVWSIGGETIYTSDGAVWNQVRVEADLDEKIATIKINGKDIRVAGTANILDRAIRQFPISVKTNEITHITLTSASGDVYFDDVKLYRTHDYDDYCPEPNPITPNNGYTLSMSVCNLWREGNHFGWDVISPYPELEPITGFYDEGIPEAMDWEIKFLTEHGITNYALCWYPLNRVDYSSGSAVTINDPLKKSRMNEALHDGYFNAKYSDLMTFNLLFENSSYTNLSEFKEVVWPYMIEWYFKDPRYLTMQSKSNSNESEIVFNVYRVDSWIQMCGGSYTNATTYNVGTGCAEVLKWMEDELKAANITDKNGRKITGIVFNFSGSMYHNDYGAHADAGGENVILYAWGNGSAVAGNPSQQQYYAALNAAGAKADGLNFVALPAAAFNDIGWRDVRTETMTKAQFKEMCDWYQTNAFTQHAYTTDSTVNAMNKFVQFDTWNEYGEGHYFYPTVARGSEYDYVGTGYDYLDAIAESFCGVANCENDVTPTDTQKLRIGHLYPATGKYNIARQHNPNIVKDSPDFITLKGGTLTESNMDSFMNVSGHGNSSRNDQNSYWTYTSRSGSYYYTWYYYEWNSTNNGVYMKESKTATNIINFDDSQFSDVAASDVKYIRFRIKGSSDTIGYKLYFKNTGMSDYDENHTATFLIDSSGECVLETSKINNWDGTISGIRLDVLASGVSIYIQEISFLQEDASDAHTAITIDDVLYNPCDYSEIRNKSYGIDEAGTGHEIYIAAQQWQGLYQKLHIVYEYERATGKLKLETPNGTIIEFTEGSSTAYVNGTAKTLSRAVDNYDGVPVIPLIFVLDNGFEAGTYTRSARAIDIDIADKFKTVYAVENGDAESATLQQFTGAQNSSGVVTRETAPGSGHGYAWKVAGTTGSSSNYRNIEFGYDFDMGVTYTLTFDIYVESYGASGEQKPATSSSIGIALRNPGVTNAPDLGVGSPTPATVPVGQWTTVTKTFTVPSLVDEVTNGRIGIFMNPYNTNYGATFYIDNVVIS